MTQMDMVLNHIKRFGSITTWEAFTNYGCTRLSGKIFNLKKQGYEIDSQTESTINRFGQPVSYKRYFLK